jgi:hypothetical protein
MPTPTIPTPTIQAHFSCATTTTPTLILTPTTSKSKQTAKLETSSNFKNYLLWMCK